MGHAPTGADRLLIRPASGRQAGAGLSARTHHWKDTRTRGHAGIESRTESTDTNLTNAPDGTPTHSQFRNVPQAKRRSMSVLLLDSVRKGQPRMSAQPVDGDRRLRE